MKHFLLAMNIFFAGMMTAKADKPLTLDECYKLAQQNYPLVKQRELLAKSKDYSLDNISRGYLPQLNISGQATYQSEVTQIAIPGFNTPEVSKDQYKLYAEINQPLTDLLVIGQQKKLQEVNSDIKTENLEVDLYKLKDRINQLFFGALLIDEQVAQNELLKTDIKNGMAKITAAINNGVEYNSNLNKLKAELLKANQRSIELKASRKAYTDMLGMFINQPLAEDTRFEKPVAPALSPNINRHELLVFDLQQKGYDAQNKLITAKNMPKLGLFFQGGVGKPSPVNMLSTDFDDYYIGGLRLSWSLTGFYTYKKEKRIVNIDRDLTNSQKETFLFNTNFTLKQQSAEVEKLNELIRTDDEIVTLRTSIKNTANVQLENGVISANDFLKEINAEDQARQNKLVHEIQLLMAQYNYQNTSGN